MQERFDIIYCECWGDIVGAFDEWSAGREDSTSPTVPYSAQFFDFARLVGARVYALSGCQRPAMASADGIVAAHHPRRVSRVPIVGYHLEQLCYALLLFRLALRYRPRVMFVDSGVSHWIFLAPLRVLGIRIVAVLHNSLWPNGFPATTAVRRLLRYGDRIFFRHLASAAFCVSSVVRRQVVQLAGKCPLPIIEFGPWIQEKHFAANNDEPTHNKRPFKVLYAGRIERNKGVFDVVEAARQLELAVPGSFAFDICGEGGALGELTAHVTALRLSQTVRLHGRLNRSALIAKYREAHVVVVPTRSDFCEGFAQVVSEAILLNRPVITNAVVPALELLADAIVEAQPDDVASLVACIRMLADDAEFFASKRRACARLRACILDVRRSYLARLVDHRHVVDLGLREGR